MNVEKIIIAILKLSPAERARVRRLLDAALAPEEITPPPTGDPPGGPPK